MTEKLKLNHEKSKLHAMRHSAEHVLTQTILKLYPGLKMAMGPATEDGFYFDFDYKEKISKDDFPIIEKEMGKIIEKNLPFKKKEISVKEARKLFKGNHYKQEWLDEIEEKDQKAVVYYTGTEFVDLCSGPHLKSTGDIGPFKLLSVAGAYWRGDENNKMLTRIYGTVFPTQKQLDKHLWQLEEAKKRDHRKLGKDLNLFIFSDLVGKGLPLFTEKGATIWREIERYVIDEEIKRGYKHVRTPNIAKTDLYRKSGHYPYYADTMYPPMKIDNEEFILRPMTCPHHFALFTSKPRSYKELPLRFAEMASLYRYEKSGELTGLIRVREFVLADSHNFIRKDQAADEINFVLDLIEDIAQKFNLQKGTNFVYRLSLGDKNSKNKYYQAPKKWDDGEKLLRKVLKQRKAPFYEAKDEAAFYGPKIDIQMKNILGKEETAFTVQYDFCLPERFDLRYINEKGEFEQPIVIHRSSVGAMERSIGFLIEHFAGAFPTWLSPTQIVIIPISDKHQKYAEKVDSTLKDNNIRFEIDNRSLSMQKRIREAEMQKIPYMLILGDKEEKEKTVSVRKRAEKNIGTMPLDKFLSKIKTEINNKL